MEKLLGYLRLTRPANVITAVADVLAGMVISGYFLVQADLWPVLLICLSTIGLYSGGIIFNDVFDAELDRVERPERPIPSGLIPLRAAIIFGSFCFAVGILAAGLYQPVSMLIAVAIVLACLTYNKWMKHHFIFGPLNMGICRGLNLLLGMSVLTAGLADWWFLALIPVVYIFAITMISRGEVHGGNKNTMVFAALLYLAVISCLFYVAVAQHYFLLILVFIVPFSLMIYRPLLTAFRNPEGRNIGKAVKAGVIALILLNATWSAAFGNWQVALCIVLLLPLSLGLSKLFAVT